MTAQDIFDKIVKHLRKQGCKAVEPTIRRYKGQCLYLTSSGLKCAVGCLIPKNKYDPSIEGTLAPLMIEKLGLKTLVPFTGLIEEMQSIHDVVDIGDWENRFARVALERNLKFKKKS